MEVTTVPFAGGVDTATRIIGMATSSATNGSLNLVASSSMGGVGSVVLLTTHFDIAGTTASVITSTNGTWSKVYSYTNAVSLVGSYWLLTNTTITAGTVISNSLSQIVSNAVTMTLFSLTNQSLTFDVGAQGYASIGNTPLKVIGTPTTNGWLVGMSFTANPPVTNNFTVLNSTNVVTVGATVYYQFTSTNTIPGLLTNQLDVAALGTVGASWISLKPTPAGGGSNIFYWSLDGGTWQNAEYSVGSGTGTQHGGVLISADASAAVVGAFGALITDDGWMDFNATNNVSLRKGSLGFWVKQSAIGNNEGFISLIGASGNVFDVLAVPTTGDVRVIFATSASGSAYDHTLSTGALTGEFFFITVAWDTDNHTIFVEVRNSAGSVIATDTGATQDYGNVPGDTLRIGHWVGGESTTTRMDNFIIRNDYKTDMWSERSIVLP